MGESTLKPLSFVADKKESTYPTVIRACYQAPVVERRAHPRHPLHLDAMITLGGFGSRACKIRDFCVGGMLLMPLEYAAQSPFANPGLVHKGDAATIGFSVPIGSDSRHFKLHAVVVRAFEGGMGVAFVNPDGAALRVLEGLARMAALSEPSQGATGGETLAGLCQDVLARRLLPLIPSFFEKIKDRLLIAAREASNNLEQSAHLDAITELERLRGLIERLFSDTLLEGFHRMGSRQCLNEQRLDDASPAELSLLDKEDLEDLLAIGEIIAKAEPRYQGLLTEIEERFSASVQVPVDKANNPVGPAAVCHAFRGAVRESDIQPRVMRLIYRVFDECVMAELGVVYEEINTVLAAKGVPPTTIPRKVRLEPHSAGSRPGGARASVVPSRPHRDSHRPTLPTLDVGEAAATASGLPLPPEGSVWRDDISFEPAGPGAGAPATLAASQPLHRGGLATHPRREPAGSWTSPPEASVSGVLGRNPAYGTARTLLQLARGLTCQNPDSVVHSSALGESTMPFAGSPSANGDIGERAGAPCHIEPATYPEPQQTAHPSLRDRLLASLKARRDDAEPAHIPEQRLDDIDFLDQILNTIADDPLVCEDAKAWIRRLAIPLGQTTIMDEEFLSSQSHPANQVINQIAQIKPALFAEDGKGGNEIVAEVTRLIEQIEGDQALDVHMFAAVQARLAAILAKQNERYAANVAQVVKAREEQQAFVKARQKSGMEVGSIARTNTKQFSDEWLGWLTQAKRVHVGDVVTLDVGSRDPRIGTLVWVGDGHNPCVFVDDLGKKLATLSLQELAMQLRRGNLTVAAASQGPVVDRAVYANLRKIHERIEYHATHDPLTGLLNPKEFQRYLGQVIETAGDENRHHALCWVRLHMEQRLIHEEAHLAREALLRGTADVLRQTLSTNAVLARTGDDEFGVLVEECDEREGCRIAEELRRLIQPYRFAWCGQELVATGRVGLVPLVDGNHTVASLLGAARSGCLPVTDKDENCGQFHTAQSAQSLGQADGGGHQLIDVDRALAESRLRLTCQRIAPVSDAGSESPHYQVVLCLEDDGGNLFPVNDNGGTAFHRKQRPLLDRQIIAQVFRWMATHKSALRGLGSVAISLSAQSLSDESFTDYLVERFTESKVPPGKICFEIAEKAIVASLTSASSLIRTIKEFGCRFALDDFGRADASYSFMKELPFNYIKIDGIFVKDIMESSSDFAVVKSINEIGHFMGKKTVAKNVQNEEVLQRVREIGVDYAQGYWIENRNRTDDSIFKMWNEPIEKPALTN